jgi:tRNA A-37 threonylcarbamoyl transferase component Bud32
MRWTVHPDFASPAFLNRLRAPEQLMEPPAQPIERDATPRVTRLVRANLPELPGMPVIIKNFQPRDFTQSVKDLFRSSRAHRAFSRALLLRKHDIATPTPVAAGETRLGCWLKESYLIAEEVVHARTLYDWRNSARQADQKKILMRAAAKMLARLHDAGFSHGDPNISNFLVRGQPYPAPDLVVIDLDNIQPRRRISVRLAARDASRLLRYLSPYERLWFDAQYCRARRQRLNARDFKRLLHGGE